MVGVYISSSRGMVGGGFIAVVLRCLLAIYGGFPFPQVRHSLVFVRFGYMATCLMWEISC
jgi:hypothetical protein